MAMILGGIGTESRRRWRVPHACIASFMSSMPIGRGSAIAHRPLDPFRMAKGSPADPRHAMPRHPTILMITPTPPSSLTPVAALPDVYTQQPQSLIDLRLNTPSLRGYS